MHIWSNIKNFLYDNNNFIAIFDNNIYLYNIKRIISITTEEVIVSFDNKKIKINGKKLCPIKSVTKEILITGNIESVNFYEK